MPMLYFNRNSYFKWEFRLKYMKKTTKIPAIHGNFGSECSPNIR